MALAYSFIYSWITRKLYKADKWHEERNCIHFYCGRGPYSTATKLQNATWFSGSIFVRLDVGVITFQRSCLVVRVSYLSLLYNRMI